MKKTIILLMALVFVGVMQAQTYKVLNVHKNGEVVQSIKLSSIDSLTVGEVFADDVEVDLGLSVKWAAYNVGATVPEEYGGYFAWGSTSEFVTVSNYYAADGKDISGTPMDVAHVRWGNGWRLPTRAEMEELISECTWEWTTLNDVNGSRVTGPNGNSIFLPAGGFYHAVAHEFVTRGEAGEYWVGDADSTNGEDWVWDLRFASYGGSIDTGYCPGCQLVRPVRK